MDIGVNFHDINDNYDNYFISVYSFKIPFILRNEFEWKVIAGKVI